MRKIKFLALIMALFIITAAVGCGNSPADDDGTMYEDYGAPFDKVVRVTDTRYDGVFTPDSVPELSEPAVYPEVSVTLDKGFVVPDTINGRKVEKIEYFQLKVFTYDDSDECDWCTEPHDFLPGETLVFIDGDTLNMDSDGVELHCSYTVDFSA